MKNIINNFKESPVWTIWLILCILAAIITITTYGMYEVGAFLIMNCVVFYIVIMWTGQTKRLNSELTKRLEDEKDR